jgi:iron complex transport system ATP-binding protein
MTCPPTHVISAKDVSFSYRPDRKVLDSLSLAVAAGDFLSLLGPNGSGKSTLLRCLLGELKVDSGQVLLDGRNVQKYSPRELARLVAYVPQFPRSAFAFTAREIVMLGRFAHMGQLGLAGPNDLVIVQLAMQMTQTEEFADRTLEELSGGEAQRVMIARALAQQPQVLLLDEPTSHLDMKAQRMIYAMMARLAHDWPMAIICVSHDINMASRFADELLLMRKGRMIARGKPAEVISHDVLAQTYDTEVELVNVANGPPLVMPK